MLTARDRLSLAQGLTVQGSAIRRRFDSVSSRREAPPTGFQLHELPLPRVGRRLVDLERARAGRVPKD
jgi:hypothetical protein